MSNFKIYIKSIFFNIILGSIIGFIISKFINYDSLEKIFLSPPGYLFPIVWTILYILMGISYGILKNLKLVNLEINLIYFSQLIINLLWPIIFFVLKWRFIAFIWIILLILLVTYMIIKFYIKNKISGLIQIPYLIWLIFAAYLNLGIYLLNK